jgi:hypothetical protein
MTYNEWERPVQSTKWDGLTVYSRKVWVPDGEPLRSQAARQTVQPGSSLYVHYSAFAGMEVDSLKEQIAVMRAMYHYHVKVKKWDDLAYNFVVFQPYGSLRLARVFVGRGSKRIPAAQEGDNTGNLAVCVVSLNEAIKKSTVSRISSIYRRVPCTKVKGHKQAPGASTACPGVRLMAELPKIREAK